MDTKKCILASALLVAVGFAMFARSQPRAASENTAKALQQLAETAAALQRSSADKALELKAAFDARARTEVARETRMCNKFMTVKEVSTDISPHLRVADAVLFVGPLPFSGVYQVTPVDINGPPWDHPWMQGHYFAVPSSVLPDVYDLHGVWVNPHNGADAREHDYTMQVTERDSDNCPSFVIVKGECHVGGPCPLDPGHANLD